MSTGPTRFERWATGLACATGILFLVCFQLDTVDVRYANTDDVMFHTVSNAGTMDNYIDTLARRESRFFLWFNLNFIHLLNQITSPFWFALHRTIILALEFGLGAWLLSRICGHRRYGWLFWVIGLGTLQLPPGFYPVLSYPPISGGLVLFLASMLFFDYAIERRNQTQLLISAAFFLASLLLHDTFAIFTPLFLLLLKARREREFRASLKELIPTLAVIASYTAIYLGYRAVTATEHTYDGTTPSWDLRSAVVAWVRFTFSVAPGFELWFIRDTTTFGPAFRDPRAALEIVRQGLSVFVLAKALLVTLSVALLLWRPHRTLTGRATQKLALALSVPAFLACVPIALSAKYQMWAHLRELPYAYSFFSCYFAWGAFAALVLSGGGSTVRPRHVIINVVCIVTVFYATVCAGVTNPRTIEYLETRYNAPPKSATLAAPATRAQP